MVGWLAGLAFFCGCCPITPFVPRSLLYSTAPDVGSVKYPTASKLFRGVGGELRCVCVGSDCELLSRSWIAFFVLVRLTVVARI